MTNFEEDIQNAMKEMMDDETIKEIIKTKIANGFEAAIDDTFKWGKLKSAIEKRVEEVLVPFIEGYDMSEYIIKLDTVLTDIIAQTALSDNKTVLENFKTLMVEPAEKTITVSKIYDRYNEFVAKKMDTIGRTVDYETGEPEYKPMETYCYFESPREGNRSWSSFQYGYVEFGVKEEDQQETLNRTLRLCRYKNDPDNIYNIQYNNDIELRSLRYMNEFDVFLLSLERSGVKIILDEKECSDEVYSETKPEPTFE